MKVLVTGAGGMLGQDVVTVADRMSHDVVGLGHDDLDITDADAVERAIDRERPGAVINCAAAANVDAIEDDDSEALRVNGRGAGYVADAASRAGAVVLYVSTDYVFDGTKGRPYTESDEPNPVNAYGRTKLAGEQATAKASRRSFIVRTSWLFGPGGPNFVETMLRLGNAGGPVVVVHDQIGTPTYTGHLAIGLARLVDSSAFGIHHMSASGSCSRYDFAMEIFRQSEVVTRVMATTTDVMADRAPRPPEAVLESGRENPIQLPEWERGLGEYLERRAQPQSEQPARKKHRETTRRQPVLELRPKKDESEEEPAEEEKAEQEQGEGEKDPKVEAPDEKVAEGEEVADEE